MTEIINFTPFANLQFSNLDASGMEFGVFMAKSAYDIKPDGLCVLSAEQEPFILTDNYFGEVNISAVRYPSDFVPYKPVSDVILEVTAYSPSGKPTPSWLVGVKVEDANGTIIQKTLRVTGPRYWVPKWKKELSASEKENWQNNMKHFAGWELSEPAPISQLDIRYEYAFGGCISKDLDEDGISTIEAYEYNPIGCGLINKEWTDHTKPVQAPQIEDPDDPISDPYAIYTPQGLGPIPPAWLPRRPLGGTYDQNWIDNIWPNWAPDYDFRFHNSAHTDLQTEKFLEGDITIELVNLHPEKDRFKLSLTADKSLVAISNSEDGEHNSIKMSRDTLFIEMNENTKTDPRVYVVSRTSFDPLNTETLNLIAASKEQLSEIETVSLDPCDVACDPAKLDPDYEEEEVA